MKKSTRALVGLVVLDAIVLAGTAWFVSLVVSGAAKTTVPREEAISTIASTGGGIVGLITVVLAVAWYVHRKNGN